jgi:hypothetical protein
MIWAVRKRRRVAKTSSSATNLTGESWMIMLAERATNRADEE